MVCRPPPGLPARTRRGSSSSRSENSGEGGDHSHGYVTVSAPLDSVNRGEIPHRLVPRGSRHQVSFRGWRFPLTTPVGVSYDDIPYDGGANGPSHPRKLAVLGRAFGLDPAPPETARILELGCALGTNILNIAYTLPNAECVGMDLFESQIAEARNRARTLGLKNMRFEAVDLLEFGDDEEPYDYILACGVFSWVPEPVRERILELCGRLLKPNGIAYITYNIYPGWYMRQPLRDLVVMASGSGPIRERIQRSAHMLDFMARATSKVKAKDETFSRIVARERAIMDTMPAEYLAHEHLESTNAPIYFKDFVAMAGEHNLQYLADASIATMFPTELDAETAEELQNMTASQVGLEQLLDFIRGRQFRQSLLCRTDVALQRSLETFSVRDLFISSSGAIIGADDPAYDPAAIKFRAGDSVVNVRDPELAFALQAITDAAPRFCTFDELLPQDADEETARRTDSNMVQLFLRGVISLEAHQTPVATTVGERPRASRAAALLVSDQVPPNLFHQTIQLQALEALAVELADGTRSIEQIRKAAVARLDSRPETAQVTDLVADEGKLAAAMDAALQGLARYGFLEQV